MKKRMFAALLSLCIMLSLLPGMALAADEILQTAADAGLLRYADFSGKNLDDAATMIETVELIAALKNLEPDNSTEPEFSDCGELTELEKGLIVAAAKGGYISGYSDDTFHPEGTITRAQFIVVACNLLHLDPVNEPTPFEDVPETHWASPYIAAFCKASAGPVTDTRFYPDNAATKRELLQNMIVLKTIPAPPTGGGGSAGMQKLDMPSGLLWGVYFIQEGTTYLHIPGMIAWTKGEVNQPDFEINIYRQGEEEPINTSTWGTWMDTTRESVSPFIEISDELENGVYYFTVQNLGDGIRYTDSDIATSGTWQYTKPSAKLPTVNSTSMTWGKNEYSGEEEVTWEKIDHEKVLGYDTEIYYSKAANGIFEKVGGTTNRENHPIAHLYDNVIQRCGEGFYRIRTRALSNDITKIQNGAWSDFSPVYNLKDANISVNTTLRDILYDGSEDVRQEVQKVETEDLKSALLADEGHPNGTADLLAQLESQTGVNVTVAVEEGFSDIPQSGVEIVGAALNDVPANTTDITLNIGAPERENVIPSMYDNTLALKFSMGLDGVTNQEALKVPVKITIPIPSNINSQYLVILHYAQDGSIDERISPYTFYQDGRWYASIVLTKFSDFVMTQEKSESGRQGGVTWQYQYASRNLTLTGTVETPNTLYLAMYSASGQMISLELMNEIPDGGMALAIPEKVATVKLMQLDGSHAPLYENIEFQTNLTE